MPAMKHDEPKDNFLYRAPRASQIAVPTQRRKLAGLCASVLFVASILLTSGAATAKAQGQLTLSPSTLNFGTVSVGRSRAISITLKNSGSSKIVFSKETTEGVEFSVVGFALPVTLEAGKELTLIVEFAPRNTGEAGGRIVFESNASNGTVYVPVNGTGVTAAAVPMALAKGSGTSAASESSSGHNTSVSSSSVPASTSVTTTGTNSSSTQRSSTLAFNATATTPVNRSATSSGNPSPARIALVQHTSRDAGTTTSATLAFSSNNTVGNWIGVCVRAGVEYETFTITDSNGNTYHKAIQFNETGSGTHTIGIFYAENIKGGANTIRVADSISSTLRFAILEYSGVAASGSLDVTATGQGSSASPKSGNAGTTANGDLLLGVIMTSDPESYTAASGYKIEEHVPGEPNTMLIAEDQVQATAGTASVSAYLGAADSWAAGLAAFKAAGNRFGTSPNLTAAPTSAVFTNVPVGTSNTQTIQLKNAGSSSGTISSLATQGTGFGTSRLTLPLTLAVGGTATFNVTFSPTNTGTFGGMLTLPMSGTGSALVIPLVGSAVPATRVLSTNPTSVNFGNVAVGGFTTSNVTLQNTGNSSITIQGITTSGTGFSAMGINAGTAIAPNQSGVLAIEFAPKNVGSVTGTITVSSNATNASTFTIPVAGAGVTSTNDVVQLNWGASTSAGVVGYNVYRSTVSGGSYALIVSSPVRGTSYSDPTVQGGITYYYVVTAVAADGAESSPSNQSSAYIP